MDSIGYKSRNKRTSAKRSIEKSSWISFYSIVVVVQRKKTMINIKSHEYDLLKRKIDASRFEAESKKNEIENQSNRKKFRTNESFFSSPLLPIISITL